MNKKWEYIDINTFCKKVADGTHDSPRRMDRGKHLVTSKHIKSRNIDFDSAYLISDKDFNKINERSQVDQWDVLISMIGEYCGFCYVERNEKIDYAVKNVGIFKVGSRIKAHWLFYYLNSFAGKKNLEGLRSGTSQPYISLGALRSLQIPITSSSEMEQIVSILSSLDNKIELNRRMNQTLEQMAQALFNHYFVDNIDPDNLPEGWRWGRISDMYKTTSGGTPSRSNPEYYLDGGIPWVKSKELNNGFILDTEEKINKIGLSNSSAKLLSKHSVLVAMYGATVGEIAILSIEATCNQAICAILPNEKFPFTFIFQFLKQNKEEVINRASGSAQQNISQIIIQNFELPIPPTLIIKKFHTVVSDLFSKVESNLKENISLTKIRDTLLPKLMSGEIDVDALMKEETLFQEQAIENFKTA